MSLTLIALLLAADPVAAPTTTPCDKPVFMVVAGPTNDRARMQAYAKAIYDSGLYQRLGGYYINAPVPLATFEGTPPPNHVALIVRFPCLANAKAFWFSRDYQDTIKPLRLNPSAGDYTVTVYAEIPLRADMVGKVGTAPYLDRFDANKVEQVQQGATP